MGVAKKLIAFLLPLLRLSKQLIAKGNCKKNKDSIQRQNLSRHSFKTGCRLGVQILETCFSERQRNQPCTARTTENHRTVLVAGVSESQWLQLNPAKIRPQAERMGQMEDPVPRFKWPFVSDPCCHTRSETLSALKFSSLLPMEYLHR